MSNRLLTWITAVLLAACGGTGTPRPEDMSAGEHEQAADKAEQSARGHDARAASAPGAARTATHRHASRALERHAEAHRAAARELRGAEAEVCTGVPEASRAVCPLMAWPVEKVEDVADGVRVTYTGGSPDELLQRSRCHAAHAAKAGDDMPGCPLAAPSLRIATEAAPGGAVLVLGSDDPAIVRELQQMYEPVTP